MKHVPDNTSDDVVPFDHEFRARYRVLDLFQGDYNQPTIDFSVYDHYGWPPFSRYEFVLLFVANYDGVYVHEKYQYHPVYRTKDSSWASCGNPYAYEPNSTHLNVEAQAVQFEPPVKFRIGKSSPSQFRARFPKKYYHRTERVARCIAGNPVSDLIAIKMAGTLGARGYAQ